MAFDFDTIVSRRGTGSYKWDSTDDADDLPMWVADMDFRTAPAVISALQERVAHGVFGYTQVPEAYYSAVQSWFSRRHGFEIERQWMLYTSGVVPAISAILRAVTHPGDKVIIQTPVYNCFFSSVRNMGCQIVENPLLNNDGRFEMDFEDLEAKASDPDVLALVLCNPHNPVGRAWTADELTRLGEICQRHGVLVISDEIHCDLVHPDHSYQPYGALGAAFLANAVICNSASKSFNIAGLQIANVIVPDERLRARVDKALNVHEVCDVNPFGIVASIAAFNDSEDWLEALRAYLHENYRAVGDFLARELPQLSLTRQEATYLCWIDCRALGISSQEIAEKLEKQAHLRVSEGTEYGAPGEGFIRLNTACPRSVLMEGLARLKTVIG